MPRWIPSRVTANRPLAELTTLNVGGPAEWHWRVESADELAQALDWADRDGMPVTILSGGSNVIVADAGVAGLVIQPDIRRFTTKLHGHDVRVTVGAGELWDAVVLRTAARGWQGIEALSGIPGWAGAAPVQNIGAYGQELADTLVSVTVIERATKKMAVIPAFACGLRYRDSRFKREAGQFVVVEATMCLHRFRRPTPSFPALAARVSENPSPLEIRQAVLALRREKSMLAGAIATADDPNRYSAGSFFTNPIVPQSVANRVRETAARIAPGESVPAFCAGFDSPNGEPQEKLSAAWLIERAGLSRGFGDGPVGLSSAHTLAIVNRGGACAAEIRRFESVVRTHVQTVWGIELEREPATLGDFDAAPFRAVGRAAAAA